MKSWPHVNIIDVGAARGALINEIVKPARPTDSYFAIGIDPLWHNSSHLYSKFLYRAIDNVNTIRLKKFYVNSDDQASSLLKMNYDQLSNDRSEVDKFYIPWANKLRNRLTILCMVSSLQAVADKYLAKKKIHFIKIDAEGNDLNVLKSLNFTNRPLFVTAECSSHFDRTKTIFKNGTNKTDLIEYMITRGYKVFHEENYEEKEDNGTQMSDIIFRNDR